MSLSKSAFLDIPKTPALHPDCEEVVKRFSGTGESYAIPHGTPYPGPIKEFFEAEGFTDPVCDENNLNSWFSGMCQIGYWHGDLDGSYLSGLYSVGEPASGFNYTALPNPTPGSMDHSEMTGIGWIHTNICTGDEKEWLKFRAASTMVYLDESACVPGPDYDDARCLNGNFGANVYSMDIEGSRGCKGYYITLIVNFLEGYYNPTSGTYGCTQDSCTYTGKICRIKGSNATSIPVTPKVPVEEEVDEKEPAAAESTSDGTQSMSYSKNLLLLLPCVVYTYLSIFF